MTDTIYNLKGGLKANTILDAYLKVDQVNISRTKKGNGFYARVVLSDRYGMISIIVFNAKSEDESLFYVSPGDYVQLKAPVKLYEGKPNISLALGDRGFRKLSEDEVSRLDMNKFVYTPKINPKELNDYINKTVQSINAVNPRYGSIIVPVIHSLEVQSGNNFFTHVAAKSIHHNFEHGLLYHTCRMLQTAEAILPIYPDLNRELLLTGIILHDAGKLVEIKGESEHAYSVEGNLLGHISIVYGEIYRLASNSGIEQEEDIQLLEHVILAHHGKMEYGSPVTAEIPEAWAIHTIDNLDAKMTVFEDAYETGTPGEMSKKRSYGIGNFTYTPKGK